MVFCNCLSASNLYWSLLIITTADPLSAGFITICLECWRSLRAFTSANEIFCFSLIGLKFLAKKSLSPLIRFPTSGGNWSNCGVQAEGPVKGNFSLCPASLKKMANLTFLWYSSMSAKRLDFKFLPIPRAGMKESPRVRRVRCGSVRWKSGANTTTSWAWKECVPPCPSRIGLMGTRSLTPQSSAPGWPRPSLPSSGCYRPPC